MTSQTRKLMFWMDVKTYIVVVTIVLGLGFGAGFGWAVAQRLLSFF